MSRLRDFIKSLDIEDIVIGLLIIITLAFHDQTKAMVIVQLLAFVSEVLIIELLLRKAKFKMSASLKTYLIWSVIFVLLGLASSIWAKNPITLYSSIISVCQIVMCSIALFCYCNKKNNFEICISMIVISCIILITRLIIKVPVSAWGDGGRVGQYLGSGNSGGYGNTGLTYVLSTGAICTIYRAKATKTKIYYILFLLFTAFSMLSGSKKAIIIFAVTLLLTALLYSNNIVKMTYTLFFAVVLVIIGWYMIMNIQILYKTVGFRMEHFMSFLEGGKTDNSTSGRYDLIGYAYNTFKQHPILGVGLDCFRHNNPTKIWAENNYLEMMADLGVIGLVAYYWYPLLITFKSIKNHINRNLLGSFALTLMICLLIIDTTMVTYRNDSLQFFLVVAAMAAYKNSG